MPVTVRTIRFGMELPEPGAELPEEPKRRRKRSAYRTEISVIEQIRREIKKRDELRAELAGYTIDAIAKRVGLHPRTVEKLLSK